ncbi:DUF4012 domain-containing protein [Georgenia soli]|uniref:DUF4012 domain-containing protein n=1 Tax=Georgenia soli TaxID=638953 RepID=UPI0014749886|nr:DUF4012 domain-containing protein [Georgenia soli]
MLVATWDARTAYVELSAAANDVQTLQDQVAGGEREAAVSTAAGMRESADAAREALHGPHWDLAGLLPVVGDDVRTLQVVSVVVDDLATDAVGQLVDAVDVLDPGRLSPVDGRIDLEPFQQAAPKVISADEAVRSAQITLKDVETADLLEQIRGPVDRLTEQVDQVAEMTATAARAVKLIPAMMGADGRREYVLLVQNNSEPRATGGLPGSYVLLTVEDGTIDLAEQRSASSMGGFTEPVSDLSRAERGLYGTQLGRYPGNVTSTPDFPRTAELAREVWRLETGTEVDGVLSVDPVALGILLGATGPVTLPTGHELTSDNAAQLLLNQVYIDVADPQDQDAFFAAAAEQIFKAFLSGPVDPPALMGALDTAAGQGRLMLWSAVPEEQALIAGTTLSGELRGSVGDSPLVGIYVHDRSGAKIAYYEHVDAQVTSTDLRPDGSQSLAVTVTVTSRVPDGIASLPSLLTGGGKVVPVGNIRTDLHVYAPTGGRIVSATSDDSDASYLTRVHDGLMVGTHRLMLEPGQMTTLEFEIETGPNQTGPPIARITPGPSVGQFSASASAYPG